MIYMFCGAPEIEITNWRKILQCLEHDTGRTVDSGSPDVPFLRGLAVRLVALDSLNSLPLQFEMYVDVNGIVYYLLGICGTVLLILCSAVSLLPIFIS